ncbi:MAG: FAD:protein FMN transferase [Prevotella sp.]|nr:FAD:protein FMN transferase [Candidatus Prevotella equi]
MKKKTVYILPIVVLIVIAIVVFGKKESNMYQHDSGFVFGTSYNITYQSDENLKSEIEAVLKEVDNSLSPFNDSSVITAVNNNKDVVLDQRFLEVFTLAKEISKDTEGAFDITVAPLVNAWGFGFKTGKMPTESDMDSLRALIGFEKVHLNGNKITKDNKDIMLDCSAIAKGYGVDAVAKMLADKGIANFMVEIGGEIVVRGTNSSNKPWHIGITKPTDDSLSVNNELENVLAITDIAMATSGNYRNFYYKGGKKYAHTINPKTGYPIQHNLLSATVLADNCATADAYATSFMVLGPDKAREILSRHKGMMAYLIYTNEKGEYAVWHSPDMKRFLSE